MERRRVVITGLGAVTPIGLTAAESWQAVKDGVCGIAPITQFDPTDLKVHLAAEVKGFVPENYMSKPEAKRMGRFTQMAVVSAKEALDGAGFTLDEAEADRCGVIVSSGIGGLSITEAEHDKGKEKGWDRVSPFYIPTGICNMAAGQIAIHTGFRGMCSCPVTACTGGTNAVGDAFHYIRDGYADVMLCGGTESAVTPLAIGAFTSMKALTQNPDPKRASIPFDAERSGFVLGEGAGVLVLEELEHYQEVNLYLRGLFPLIGFKSTTVLYDRKARIAGETHYPMRKMIGLAIDGITSLSVKPLHLIAGFGLGVSLLSMLGIIWSVYEYFRNATIPGWSSTICIICFLSGVQLISIGILGEYLGKTYMEVKKRPRYIISERTGGKEEGPV